MEQEINEELLIPYIEKVLFGTIDNEYVTMQRFQRIIIIGYLFSSFCGQTFEINTIRSLFVYYC